MSEKLTLEEIKKMSDLELDYEIHKLISGEVEIVNPDGGERFLLDPKYRHQLSPTFKNANGDEPLDLLSINYKYTTDLNKIAGVEEFVIEEIGSRKYGRTLLEITTTNIIWNRLISKTDKYAEIVSHVGTATARQRAEACLLALSEVQS